MGASARQGSLGRRDRYGLGVEFGVSSKLVRYGEKARVMAFDRALHVLQTAAASVVRNWVARLMHSPVPRDHFNGRSYLPAKTCRRIVIACARLTSPHTDARAITA
jgi:hypothetical protein